MKKIISTLYVFIIITSCAPTKQFVAFQHNNPIEDSKGRIYVIKPAFVGSAVKTAIFCNDILVGNTANGSYLCWDVEEGICVIGNTQHVHNGTTLGSASGEDVFRINVKKGKTYYLKQVPHFGGISFEIMDKEEGEKSVKSRKKPTINYAE
jgi:hypothetical protein